MTRSFQELAGHITALTPSAGDTVIVGIDGGGGAGKSTFAANLSECIPNSQVIHTDDFASWDNPFDWWSRFEQQVLIPVSRREPTRFQRYDWVKHELTDWIHVTGSTLIIEGVSSLRREFRRYLAYRVWIDCPADERLRRGLERDGDAMRDAWDRWMESEREYARDHRPKAVADLVVNGFPSTPPPSGSFEVREPVRCRRANSSDAVAIAHVRNAAWREAYAHILPKKALAELDAKTAAKRIRGRILEGGAYAVAEVDGQVVGFASWGENNLQDVDAEVQLFALYIHPLAYGCGAGTALIQFVANELRHLGLNRMSIGVFTANERAKGFYDSIGAEFVALSTYAFGGVDYPTESRLLRFD